jgi:hypothetical protein
MRVRLAEIVARLGISATTVRDDPGEWIEAVATHGDMRLRVYARNFDINGCNRGDSVPVGTPPLRTSPCLSPFYHLYIDFNGSVMPCCNLRSDVPTHADAVVGHLGHTTDLFRVYAGEALASWRRHTIGFNPKSGHCAACAFVPVEASAANRAVNDRLVTLACHAGVLGATHHALAVAGIR